MKDTLSSDDLESIARAHLSMALLPDALKEGFNCCVGSGVDEDALNIFIVVGEEDDGDDDHWAANCDPDMDGIRPFLYLNETDIVLFADVLTQTLNMEYEGAHLKEFQEQADALTELAWRQFPFFADAVRKAGIDVSDETLAACLSITVEYVPVGSLTEEDIIGAWEELRPE